MGCVGFFVVCFYAMIKVLMVVILEFVTMSLSIVGGIFLLHFSHRKHIQAHPLSKTIFLVQGSLFIFLGVVLAVVFSIQPIVQLLR